MFGFLKKLFGLDQETMKDAGVQIEQQVPYKVEASAQTDKVAVVNSQPVEKTIKEVQVVSKKSAGKKSTPKKEGAKKPTGNRGRKPKVK
jgi:hypothetical protein